METYKFDNCTVRVIDCTNDAVNFRICEVFNLDGKKVYEIRTTKKGKYAAKLAESDAIHFRLV